MPDREWRFNRYHDGRLMAEGASVHAPDLGTALKKAKALYGELKYRYDKFELVLPPDYRNARAARLAGWTVHPTERMGQWWFSPYNRTSAFHPPAYNQSLDLIRRDLLPLVEKARKQIQFAWAMERLWLYRESGESVTWQAMEWRLLTAPASVVLDAVLEALEGVEESVIEGRQ